MARKGRNNILLIFSCIVILVESSYSQTDKLLQGQVLQSGKALVSASEKFRLGFFSAGNGFQYLGIWFNHRPGPNREHKPVWVANRNIPILDTDSVYLIVDSTDGNLKILRNGGNPIALSSVQGASNTSVSATLLQSGNFVLHELNSNGSIRRMLWQSFDYPTDTLLPGMKLGINFKTGHKWFLQSWITDESPAQGSFTLGMDPNFTNRLTVWWRGERVQDSRPWLNGRLISSPSEIYVNLYNFSYTSNEREKYFSFSANEDESSFQLVRIDSDSRVNFGEGWNYIVPEWHDEESPTCNGSGYDDYEIKYGFMSEDGFKFKESDNMTEFDCRIKCLINCSCSAFATTYADNNTGCEIWSRGTKFTESHEDNDRLTYIKIEHTEVEHTEVEPKVAGQKKKWHPMIIIGIVIALLVLLMCCLGYGMRRKYKGKEEKWWLSLIIVVGVASLIPLLGCLCYLMWGKLKAKVQNIMNRKKLLRELGDNVSLLTTHYRGKRLENDRNMKLELKIFDFQIIAAATNNFSVTNKLGEGGFGPVYKGQLLDGQEIAIKRLSRSSRQGIVEFKNEAKLIAKLQHTNLVRLLGCSLHGEERLLVYEYMPNKSLDFFIFNSEKKNILNWKKRFSIIEGIAQGLLYLHKYSRLRVIHRDLKASNILLDDQMNPKISDFGMARIFGVNEAEANTNRIVGTYGYMSPEYAMSGIISMKTDVFSFGVLVLEIVSGKKNHGCYDPDRPLNLIGYAWQLLNEGKALELIDLSLKESCSANENEVLRCIHVGLLCVQDQAMDRPSIFDVIFMLKNETMALPLPKQPAFFINVNTDDQETEVPENKEENCSTNDVTTTTMEAR